MFKGSRKDKSQSEPAFAVGDKVDVHSSYAASEPERDCTGQAVIADVVPGLFGDFLYGVAFPNMVSGFKFYWIQGGLLRLSAPGPKTTQE